MPAPQYLNFINLPRLLEIFKPLSVTKAAPSLVTLPSAIVDVAVTDLTHVVTVGTPICWDDIRAKISSFSLQLLSVAKLIKPYLDKFVRFTISASKRQSRDKLFFNYKLKTPLNPEQVRNYSDSLEMVRLAPSSGNTQPWRVFFDESANEFHFFKKSISKRYELRGLHDIDMGIALSHFELTSLQNGLSGIWLKHSNENVNSIDDLQYIRTWKSE